MAPGKRSPELQRKIQTLQLTLSPLVPLPRGNPHPAFPQTLLAYHLLTEDELDGIAHHYHQSTPSRWTYEYPECMNWDKEWLDASKQSASGRRQSQAALAERSDWLNRIIINSSNAAAIAPENDPRSPTGGRRSSSVRPSGGLTDAERIAIKRRKVGKFIGLIGMDTPADEIEGRIRYAMDRAVAASKEELQRTEEWYMRRRKAF